MFMIFGIVSAWAEKALKDGRISIREAADLAEPLGAALGIPTELAIPGPAAEIEEVLPETEEKPDAETEEVPLKLRAFT